MVLGFFYFLGVPCLLAWLGMRGMRGQHYVRSDKMFSLVLGLIIIGGLIGWANWKMFGMAFLGLPIFKGNGGYLVAFLYLLLISLELFLLLYLGRMLFSFATKASCLAQTPKGYGPSPFLPPTWYTYPCYFTS